MELLFHQGQMCLLFMCMLGHYVTFTVLVVPKAFRGLWQRRWTATQRVPLQWHKQFWQSLEEGARKRCSRVCSSICLPLGITGGLKAPCICFDHVAVGDVFAYIFCAKLQRGWGMHADKPQQVMAWRPTNCHSWSCSKFKIQSTGQILRFLILISSACWTECVLRWLVL